MNNDQYQRLRSVEERLLQTLRAIDEPLTVQFRDGKVVAEFPTATLSKDDSYPALFQRMQDEFGWKAIGGAELELE